MITLNSSTDIKITPKRVFMGNMKSRDVLEVKRLVHSGKGFTEVDDRKLTAANFTRLDSETYASLDHQTLNDAYGALKASYGEAIQVNGKNSITHSQSDPIQLLPNVIYLKKEAYPVQIIDQSSSSNTSYICKIPLHKSSTNELARDMVLNDLSGFESNGSLYFPMSERIHDIQKENQNLQVRYKSNKKSNVPSVLKKKALVDSIKFENNNIEIVPSRSQGFTEDEKLKINSRLSGTYKIQVRNKEGHELITILPKMSKNKDGAKVYSPQLDTQLGIIETALSEEMNRPPMKIVRSTYKNGNECFDLCFNPLLKSSINNISPIDIKYQVNKGKGLGHRKMSLFDTAIMQNKFSRHLSSSLDLNVLSNRQADDSSQIMNAVIEANELYQGNEFISVDSCIDTMTGRSNSSLGDDIYSSVSRYMANNNIDWDASIDNGLSTTADGVTVKKISWINKSKADSSASVLLGRDTRGLPSVTIHNFSSYDYPKLNLQKVVSDSCKKNIKDLISPESTDARQRKILQLELETQDAINFGQKNEANRKELEILQYNESLSEFKQQIDTADSRSSEVGSVQKKNILKLLKSKPKAERSKIADKIRLKAKLLPAHVNDQIINVPALLIESTDFDTNEVVYGQRHIANEGKRYIKASKNIISDKVTGFVVDQAGFDYSKPTIVRESPLDSVIDYISDPERDKYNYVAGFDNNGVIDLVTKLREKGNEVTVFADFDRAKLSGNTGVKTAMKLSKDTGSRYSFLDTTRLSLANGLTGYKDIGDFAETPRELMHANNLAQYITGREDVKVYKGDRVYNRLDYEQVNEDISDYEVLNRIISENKPVQISYDQLNIIATHGAYQKYKENIQQPIQTYADLYKELIPYQQIGVENLHTAYSPIDEKTYNSVRVLNNGTAYICKGDLAGIELNTDQVELKKDKNNTVSGANNAYISEMLKNVLDENISRGHKDPRLQTVKTAMKVYDGLSNKLTNEEKALIRSEPKYQYQSLLGGDLDDREKFKSVVRENLAVVTDIKFETDEVSKKHKSTSNNDVVKASIELLKNEKDYASYYLLANDVQNNSRRIPYEVSFEQNENQFKVYSPELKNSIMLDENELKNLFSKSLSAMPPTPLYELQQYNLNNNIQKMKAESNSSFYAYEKILAKENTVGKILPVAERAQGWGGRVDYGSQYGSIRGADLTDRIVGVNDKRFKPPLLSSLTYTSASGNTKTVSETIHADIINIQMKIDNLSANTSPVVREHYQKELDNSRMLLEKNIDNSRKVGRTDASKLLVPVTNFTWGYERNGVLQKSQGNLIASVKQKLYDYTEALAHENISRKSINEDITKRISYIKPKQDITVPGVLGRELTAEEDQRLKGNRETTDRSVKTLGFPVDMQNTIEMVLSEYTATSPIMAYSTQDPISRIHDRSSVTISCPNDVSQVKALLDDKQISYIPVNTCKNSRELNKYSSDKERRITEVEKRITPIGFIVNKAKFESEILPILDKANKINPEEYSSRQNGNNSYGITAKDRGETLQEAFSNMEELCANPPTYEKLQQIRQDIKPESNIDEIENHYKQTSFENSYLNAKEGTAPKLRGHR